MTFASNIFALHPVAQMPELIPPKLDDLLPRRVQSDRAAQIADFVGLVRHSAVQTRFSARLTAHIERRASE